MDKLLSLILKYKKTVVTFFLIATLVSAFASTFVKVNYNIMDYLPDAAPSTIALEEMNEQYTDGTPNLRVLVKDVSVSEVLKIKEKLKTFVGVEKVTWLDDAENIYQPMEFIPQKTLDEYYKANNALITLTIDDDKKVESLTEIRDYLGYDCPMSGKAINDVTAIEQTSKEVQLIMILVCVIVLIILILTTDSFFEPVLFLITIGIAIMINRGTNVFLGEISFVTNAAGSVLQLAVSMDYSIILVHRFAEIKKTMNDDEMAMVKAVEKTFGSIMSSGLTTVMGFAALILMKFKIGPDMGIVMAKSIAISLFTVILFLPSATLLTYKLVLKTHHRMIIPSFNKFGKFVVKYRRIIVVIFIIITIPSYLGQNENKFTYGSSGIYGEGTQLGDNTKLIEDTFGKSNLMVIMVPKGHPSLEKNLADDLKLHDKVTSVISYASSVGETIPESFVPKDTYSQLISDKYSRFVITVNTEVEGDEAFGTVDESAYHIRLNLHHNI